MTQMHVTNESPTKITLELDPDWKADISKTNANSRKQGRACLGCVAIAFLLILTVLGYSISTNSLSSLPWYFWVFTVIVFIGGLILVIFKVSFQSSGESEVEEVTVTIDLDSQQAVRVEILASGKRTQSELELEQVTRVLIHGNYAEEWLELSLESEGNPPFEVNSEWFFFEPQPMIEFGKKLGAFIKKPVVFKMTDAGKPVSEETVQT